MKILITGGTGFIGSNLAQRCIERGHAVTVFGQTNTPREEQNLERVRAAGAEAVVASIHDRDALDKALDGVDVVFHLAAAQHEMNVPDEHFWNVNVKGTETILDAAEAKGVGRFVYGSTIGVYGKLAGEIDETTPVNPDNVYGVTKLEAERRVLARKDRMSVVAIRIPETYGPGDGRLLKLFKSIKKGVFFNIGRGENKHHPIYIDDLIDGMMLAATSDKANGEVFVFSGKDAPTTNEMVGAIADELGIKAPTLRAPLGLFMIAAIILESLMRPIGLQPPLHRRRMDFFRKSFTFSSRKAAQVLGFEPSATFRQGVTHTAKWYAETGQL